MPSGINPSLGCGPFGCREKDYYLPGKGVWAPKPMIRSKALFGAIGGSAVGAYVGAKGGSPLSTAVGSVVGLFLGYEIGTTFDKIDQIHTALLWQRVLDKNPDGIPSSWRSPYKPISIVATPISTNGDCREFVTKVIVDGKMKKLVGTACKINGEWEVKEMNS